MPTRTSSEHSVSACAPESEAAFDPDFAKPLGGLFVQAAKSHVRARNMDETL